LFDDALISMRYAWNFSHGYGLVWNPGEYVEGYTNPLMTLLMSLPTLLFDKVNAVLTVQVLGIAFMLINAYLVMAVAKHLTSERERYRRLFLVLAFLCALSYYPLVYWSLMGMETGLLAVLMSLSILAALRYAKEHRAAQGILLSVSLGLAFLTRPDTLVFAIPIFVYAFYPARNANRTPSLYFLLAMVSLYIAFIVGQELFRWGYYGEWVPNTYTLKMSKVPFFVRFWGGMYFVGRFLWEVYVPVIVVIIGVVYNFRRDKLLLASIFVVLVCYQVWTGGDAWDYWRFLSPAMPIMMVLATYEILMAMESAFATAVFRRYFFLRNPIVHSLHVPGFLTCLLLLAMLLSINYRFLPEIAMQQVPEEVTFNQGRVQTALAIERVTTHTATVGVTAAGIIPYYTGRPAIDFLGKSDPRIARMPPDLSARWDEDLKGMLHLPGHDKYDLEYSLKELKPTYVQNFAWGRQNFVDWAKSEYVLVAYKGVTLPLLKRSKDVRWDDIEAARERGEATFSRLR
jgi:arabinofuranosyltransferase